MKLVSQTCSRNSNEFRFKCSKFRFKWDALRDLVPFAQFEKREKHPWRSVSKSAGFSNTPPWVFFLLFKLYVWYRIAQDITNSVPTRVDGFRNSFERLFI